MKQVVAMILATILMFSILPWEGFSLSVHATAAQHVYTDACDDVCDLCGNVRMIGHRYDSACDRVCNVCGFSRGAFAPSMTILDQPEVIRAALDVQEESAELPHYIFQSIAYNSNKDVVLLGFSWEDEKNIDGKALLVEMTSDFSAVVAGYELEGLYHCNDMTYNPQTNKIYVAICNKEGIAVVDSDTMTVEDVHRFNGDYFAQITYDAVEDVFFLGNSDALHVADGDLRIHTSVSVRVEEPSAPSEPELWQQGSDMLNGEFARVLSVVANEEEMLAGRVEFYNFRTGRVTHFVEFPVHTIHQEAEALVAVGDHTYLIGRSWSDIVVEELLTSGNSWITPCAEHTFDAEYNGDCERVCVGCHDARTDIHTYSTEWDTRCEYCDHVRETDYTGWVEEENHWYFYDNGVMLKNAWQQDKDGWCYVGADGAMVRDVWVSEGDQWRYVGTGGHPLTDIWVEKGDDWVYLDEDGYMLTDRWIPDKDGWCYVGADGAMVRDVWVSEGDQWRYVGTGGHPLTDIWVEKGDGWVYLDKNGYMLTNAWQQDSKGWCYVGSDGYCVTNQWMKDSVGWCYLGQNGRMRTNAWIQDSVGWCYVDGSGYIVKNNWVQDGGKWYYLNKDGYMLSNTWQLDSVGWCYLGQNGRMRTNAWIQDSVGWCYVGANGYIVKNAWVQDGGKWYYLNKNGYMLSNTWQLDSVGWCYLGANGAMRTKAWIKDRVGWCYVGANGYIVKNNWLQDGDKWYYLDGNGYMVTGTKTIGGKKYTFNASGVWVG